MAYEQSSIPRAQIARMSPVQSTFDKLVALRIGAEWIGIDTVMEAQHMLRQDWPVAGGPSFTRALAACNAVLEGHGSIIAARAAFTVAVMEAGLAFELFEDRLSFLDFQVAHATAEDVKNNGYNDEE